MVRRSLLRVASVAVGVQGDVRFVRGDVLRLRRGRDRFGGSDAQVTLGCRARALRRRDRWRGTRSVASRTQGEIQ